MYHRYAIYFTPAPNSGLAQFGASWLGWDGAGGTLMPNPDIQGLDVAQITDTPRKYGFHGTIKPPFFLAPGKSADGLTADLKALCAQMAPVKLEGLQLARLGRFLALIPTGDVTALASLAAHVVEGLDTYRAPPSKDELNRRRSANLNAAQQAHLEHWGYPYVMDQFKFHMTLTGRLDADTLNKTEEALSPLLAEHVGVPLTISDLTLLGSDDDGRFHHISRHRLGA